MDPSGASYADDGTQICAACQAASQHASASETANASQAPSVGAMLAIGFIVFGVLGFVGLLVLSNMMWSAL